MGKVLGIMVYVLAYVVLGKDTAMYLVTGSDDIESADWRTRQGLTCDCEGKNSIQWAGLCPNSKEGDKWGY